MRNTMPENDMEHALETAMIAHAIAVIGNVRYNREYNAEYIMALAMYHDACEVITGDLPTPIKHHNPAIKAEYSKLEDIAAQKLISMLPPDLREYYTPLIAHDESTEEWKIVKAADRICAYIKCLEERKSGRRKRGGSTISQQTAKNVFCWPRSSWVRKGVETYFTFLIETFWSKERIMEVYLNVIEMGPGIYGAEQAAQTYFHCHASQLSAHQAALITACYPSPQKRNPAKPTSYLLGRAANIEAKMARYGTPKFTKEYIAHVRERYLQSVQKMEKSKAKRKSKGKNKGKKLDLKSFKQKTKKQR
jgi:5'-deoxynucleotidase YfbR-like HD superfamily hydrolase